MNQQPHQSPRDRIAAGHEAQRRKALRRRQLFVAATVLVVVAAAVGIGIALSSSATTPKAYTAPVNGTVVADPFANPAAKATALAYGPATAPHTLTVFEDFRCPYCKALETGSSSVYKTYAAAGTLRVLFHPVTLIDANAGGSGALRAGNAAACAATAGRFIEYHDVLFTDQPSETTDGYGAAATLIAESKKVPGLDSPAFESCVTADTYQGLVQQNWTDFNTLRLTGTPTLLLDGKPLTLPSALWKASADGRSLEGSDPAVLRQVLQAAGLPSAP